MAISRFLPAAGMTRAAFSQQAGTRVLKAEFCSRRAGDFQEPTMILTKYACAITLVSSLSAQALAAQDAGSGPTAGATSKNDAGSGPTQGAKSNAGSQPTTVSPNARDAGSGPTTGSTSAKDAGSGPTRGDEAVTAPPPPTLGAPPAKADTQLPVRRTIRILNDVWEQLTTYISRQMRLERRFVSRFRQRRPRIHSRHWRRQRHWR